MGFLTGAYLKMASARMRLQLQNELTSITMQMQRVTKQMGQMEKMLNSQQRSAEVAMRSQMQYGIFAEAQRNGFDLNNPGSMFGADPTKMSAFSAMQQQMQYRMASAQSIWADHFENLREAQLEPLKNLETSLSIRKANIESRLKLIEGQEEASKQMEKSSQKDFVPEYTGQG